MKALLCIFLLQIVLLWTIDIKAETFDRNACIRWGTDIRTGGGTTFFCQKRNLSKDEVDARPPSQINRTDLPPPVKDIYLLVASLNCPCYDGTTKTLADPDNFIHFSGSWLRRKFLGSFYYYPSTDHDWRDEPHVFCKRQPVAAHIPVAEAVRGPWYCYYSGPKHAFAVDVSGRSSVHYLTCADYNDLGTCRLKLRLVTSSDFDMVVSLTTIVGFLVLVFIGLMFWTWVQIYTNLEPDVQEPQKQSQPNGPHGVVVGQPPLGLVNPTDNFPDKPSRAYVKLKDDNGKVVPPV